MPAPRTTIPVVAIVAGSLLGLRPSFGVTSSRARLSGPPVTLAAAPCPAPSRIRGAPPSAVPPLEPAVAPSDAAELPDLRAGFPDLNPEDRVDRAWLLTEGPAHGPRDGRRLVTFTFDDGPFPETAPWLLRILAEHKVR